MPRRQWETLINLGRQDIHLVRAADVMHAPTFAEVAPLLVALLDGRGPCSRVQLLRPVTGIRVACFSGLQVCSQKSAT
ncbi:hypothetical protein [Cryobacterium sp. Y57]|uniref:hypothetical protein n=1 Tax=Cryobacterium sp. Y57 TaxID=2048287 RepID=UPI0011AFFFD7|nr:hypothetical protein [Cryobacterium sp. Y57]